MEEKEFKRKAGRPRTRRKEIIQYSEEVCKFICWKIKEGESLRGIVRKYPDRVPCKRTIWQWKHDYPNFKKDLDDAYQIFFYDKLDEIEELSSILLEEQEEASYRTKEEAMSRRL